MRAFGAQRAEVGDNRRPHTLSDHSALVDHTLELQVSGGSPVGSSFQDVGDTQLTMKVDRQELIQSIQPGIAAELIQPDSVD